MAQRDDQLVGLDGGLGQGEAELLLAHGEVPLVLVVGREQRGVQAKDAQAQPAALFPVLPEQPLGTGRGRGPASWRQAGGEVEVRGHARSQLLAIRAMRERGVDSLLARAQGAHQAGGIPVAIQASIDVVVSWHDEDAPRVEPDHTGHLVEHDRASAYCAGLPLNAMSPVTKTAWTPRSWLSVRRSRSSAWSTSR